MHDDHPIRPHVGPAYFLFRPSALYLRRYRRPDRSPTEPPTR